MFLNSIIKGFVADRTKPQTSADGAGDVWAAVARDLEDINIQRARARATAGSTTKFDAASVVMSTAWLRSRRNEDHP